MERFSVAGAASAIRTFEDGTAVSVRKVEVKRPIPGPVAEHESAHVVAAGKIVSATIIPSGDALGTTQPVKMTAQAAAAAEALGCSGTGHDMFITEHVLGVDPSVAKSAARSALSGKSEEMYEVATLLQERSTIGQADVEEARENVKKRNQGIFPVEVEIIAPDGRRQSITAKSFRGEISIADLSKLLPKAT